MTSKNSIKYVAMIIATILIVSIIMNINIDFFSKNEYKEDKIFPGIIGDMILKSNDTGIDTIKDMVTYDDFRGDIIQGYKANYTGSNGTTVIYVAQMKDEESAMKSTKDMIIRSGYNESANEGTNESANITDNVTVVKLPVENPEVFVMQKNIRVPWHYVFADLDKVYWIGFSNRDTDYQMEILIEIYRNIAEKITTDI